MMSPVALGSVERYMIDLYCRIEGEYQTIDFMPNSYTHTFLSITIHNSSQFIQNYNNFSHTQTNNSYRTII